MSGSYTGRCACGAVRYEIAAEPIFALICQCRDCQRATGTGHVNAISFPKEAVAMTGALRFYESKAESGRWVRRGFCPNCGSPVAWNFEFLPDRTVFMAGSLDEPGIYAPALACFTASGHAWDTLDPSLPKFERAPKKE